MSWLSVVLINHRDQTPLGEYRVYFYFQIALSHLEGKIRARTQGRNLKTGPEAKAMK